MRWPGTRRPIRSCEEPRLLTGKRIVVTGGTGSGSLGTVLVCRLLSGTVGTLERVVFSRDEAKQHAMHLAYEHVSAATDEVIYHDYEKLLQFPIGDARYYTAVGSVLREAEIVVNSAVLKQVRVNEDLLV